MRGSGGAAGRRAEGRGSGMWGQGHFSRASVAESVRSVIFYEVSGIRRLSGRLVVAAGCVGRPPALTRAVSWPLGTAEAAMGTPSVQGARAGEVWGEKTLTWTCVSHSPASSAPLEPSHMSGAHHAPACSPVSTCPVSPESPCVREYPMPASLRLGGVARDSPIPSGADTGPSWSP